MLCCNSNWRRDTLVSWEERTSHFCFGAWFNIAVLMSCARWLSCLPCWAALTVQVNFCALSSTYSSRRGSFLLLQHVLFCLACCILRLRIPYHHVASCRCSPISHPSECWRLGFRSPPRVFWMWQIAWKSYGYWVFECSYTLLGMKAIRKAADWKIPSVHCLPVIWIKLRCSLNPTLPLFGLGPFVCSMSEERVVYENRWRSGMAKYTAPKSPEEIKSAFPPFPTSSVLPQRHPL